TTTQINLPIVSKIDISKNAITTVQRAFENTPPKSKSKKTSAGGVDTKPSNSNIPRKSPKTAVINIPINKAPFTLRAIKINVINKPAIASAVPGSRTSPNDTNVSSFAMTRPDCCNPKNAINKPIPAVIPNLSGAGIALIINSRNDVNDNSKKIIPAHISAPNTASYDTPCVATTLTK